MATTELPPAPTGATPGSFVWQEWYNQLDRLLKLQSSGTVTLSGAQTVTGSKTFAAAPQFTAAGAPFIVSSTTNVPNLNASLLSGFTWDSPGSIGSITAGTIRGTTITATSGFGCNGKPAQLAFASGGALAGYAGGASGFASGAQAQSLYNMVVAIRAALVANGIMS